MLSARVLIWKMKLCPIWICLVYKNNLSCWIATQVIFSYLATGWLSLRTMDSFDFVDDREESCHLGCASAMVYDCDIGLYYLNDDGLH